MALGKAVALGLASLHANRSDLSVIGQLTSPIPGSNRRTPTPNTFKEGTWRPREYGIWSQHVRSQHVQQVLGFDESMPFSLQLLALESQVHFGWTAMTDPRRSRRRACLVRPGGRRKEDERCAANPLGAQSEKHRVLTEDRGCLDGDEGGKRRWCWG